MKNSSVMLMMLFTIAACQDHSTADEKQAEENAVNQTTVSGEFCYGHSKKRNTILLHIIQEGTVVSGDLVYKLPEKDKNSGIIKGEMHGDTLFANYEFMSEGVISDREVAFLKTHDGMVEGYGEMKDENGKMIFKNRSALNFSGTVLKRMDCK
jgi:hypothetical protein